MQFRMHQEVLDCVATFFGTKGLHGNITTYPYLTGLSIFLLGFFEGDVTTRYAGWWKQSILYHHRDFAKNITQ